VDSDRSLIDNERTATKYRYVVVQEWRMLAWRMTVLMTFTGSRDSNRSFNIISTLYCSFENTLALFEHPEERRSKERDNLFWNAQRARDLTRVH
jgi:hypothetical protein